MDQRPGIRAGNQHAHRAAAIVLIAGLALPGSPTALRAADAGATEGPAVDSAALAQQARHRVNDSGQFYMAWWLPPVQLQAIMRDANFPPAERERMLATLGPYLVFAISRGQEGEHTLVDAHDRADLLRHSRLSVNGQALTTAPADQNDPVALAALDSIRPALAAMLGREGYGIEFSLYRPPPGKAAPDPTLPGSLEYTLYHKHFRWDLPLWAPAAVLPVRAVAAAMPAPVVAAAPAPAALPATTTVAPIRPPAAAPVPAQRRKVDPTSGEEFPERYDYNPYTGQKLVNQ